MAVHNRNFGRSKITVHNRFFYDPKWRSTIVILDGPNYLNIGSPMDCPNGWRSNGPSSIWKVQIDVTWMVHWTVVHLDGPNWCNIGGPLDCRPFGKVSFVHHNNLLTQPWPSSCWPAHRMAIHSNPLLNGLIQQTFKIHFVFVEIPSNTLGLETIFSCWSQVTMMFQ